jgi:Fungal Zn(2)-Cys(6) binuclear cluster domain
MESYPIRHTQPQQQHLQNFKVRAACEACHRRKIKCQPPAGGGVCQACEVNDRKCLFAPRAKAGRPRIPRNNHPEPSIYQRPMSAERDDLHEMLNGDGMNGIQLSSNLDWTDLSNIEVADLFTEDCSPLPLDRLNGRPEQLVANYNETKRRESSPGISGTDTSSSRSVDCQPRSLTLERPPIHDAFTSLLHACAELQSIHQGITQSGVPPRSQLQLMLQKLDTSGDVVIDIIGQIQVSSHVYASLTGAISALSTLVVTTMLRLLEVCDLLSQNTMPMIQTLSQVQLLKRIDFNIAQVRTAVKKLEAVHPSLGSVTKDILVRSSLLRIEIQSATNELPIELGGIL